jgi:hypothetical protein
MTKASGFNFSSKKGKGERAALLSTFQTKANGFSNGERAALKTKASGSKKVRADLTKASGFNKRPATLTGSGGWF